MPNLNLKDFFDPNPLEDAHDRLENYRITYEISGKLRLWQINMINKRIQEVLSLKDPNGSPSPYRGQLGARVLGMIEAHISLNDKSAFGDSSHAEKWPRVTISPTEQNGEVLGMISIPILAEVSHPEPPEPPNKHDDTQTAIPAQRSPAETLSEDHRDPGTKLENSSCESGFRCSPTIPGAKRPRRKRNY